ncbi:Serine/threonine-protein kinase PknB [Rubripirellula lacrimiformis]|uniref:Serine/threonine-protein kinase PknB n=1 Tax=Rubripirellula lacrimiformis TaxID=1930273 RepID=A0A517NI18_9BACT|nr:serine/threonine-protein kinase [Rubripirellula lacrimiformis]QDT06718.1 Serine/threonine-protein kinase PknB [Rubripirellula lacrimiformis]
MNNLPNSDAADARSDDWLGDCLEALALRGPVDQPSQLSTLLPVGDIVDRRIALVELIKLDMAMVADIGRFRGIDEYLDVDAAVLSPANVPLDLVMEEIQIRKDLGQTPDASEYQQRYPAFAAMLGPLEQSIAAMTSSSIAGPPPEIDLGESVDDFLILQKLGQGAFAHVYLAQQVSMRRLVALKVSRGKGGESESLAQFDHPNIVRVYDQRQLTDPALHLLYMQFVPGGTLADVVKSARATITDTRRTPQTVASMGGTMLLQSVDEQLLSAAQIVPEDSATRRWLAESPWPQVVAWVGIHLARALHEAHSQQILHRDVKPANVLLTAEGVPKLADFNVSFSESAEQVGKAASLGGSLAYMSPEHLRAIIDRNHADQDQIREPADLYSLGVLLWELWQGRRPFDVKPTTLSWNDAATEQLSARDRPLIPPNSDSIGDAGMRDNQAAQRVLEKTLRRALAIAPEDRFVDGAEMAGRLRLALHPQAATLFDPPDPSLRSWLSKQSPWIMACLVLLIPHGIAGGLNYHYNFYEVMQTPHLKETLRWVSWIVNLTYFPLAAVLAILQTRSMVRAVDGARYDTRIESSDLSGMLDLGHNAAMIGGSLWFSSGLLFPLVFQALSPDFTMIDSLHLFMSSLICGGIAMAYPYFGTAWLATFVFYPLCLRRTMQDADFDARASRMINRGELYRLIAAIIPLLGGALMLSSPSTSRSFMFAAIAAGVFGVLVASFIHHQITEAWSRMGQVLSTKLTTTPA